MASAASLIKLPRRLGTLPHRRRGYLAGLLLVAVLPALADDCARGGVRVSSEFPSGAMAGCTFTADNVVRVTLTPESEPINPSPWYAFAIASARDTTLRIELDYGSYKHRYQPDVKQGDTPWQALPESALATLADGQQAVITLPVRAGEPTLLAAQPILDVGSYATWIDALPATVTATAIGTSPKGLPLWRLITAARPQTLLILGRQHPPETTGALAMRAFVERLLADDPLASGFRARVGLLIYPLLNPDGVDAGHWRHNTGAVDLNRDWGPFTQPETRTVAADIDRYLTEHETKLIKALDFHSTYREVFYTQEDNTAQIAPQLMPAWLADFETQMQRQWPGFAANRSASNNPQRPTAKSFFNRRYGVASTTVEIADSSDPDFIEEYAVTAAESLMRQWPAAETSSAETSKPEE